MSDLSVYGPIVTGYDVTEAVVDTIKLWMPTYLAILERKYGREPQSFPTLRSYVTMTDPDPWVEDQLPGCVVVAPGLLTGIERHGGGVVSAPWAVGVGVVVSSQDRANTLRLAQIYSAAVRMCLLQHKSLGGFAEDTWWIDEAYDDYSFEESRNMASGLVGFGVLVHTAAVILKGTMVPPDDPYTPAPEPATVQSVFVSVDREV